MKYLGIDHAKRSGYGLIDTDTNEIITGSFTIQNKTSNPGKIHEFKGYVEELIKQYKPDVICAERPMDKVNGATTTLLIGYYTMICALSYQYNIDIIECYPTSVKKRITGNGKAEKIDVARELSKQYNIPLENLATPVYYQRDTKFHNAGDIKGWICDEGDALALAHYGRLEREL